MMAKDAIIQYLPVTTVISLLAGAVWINSNLGSMSGGIALLTEKMDHSNELQDVRMSANEVRMDRMEESAKVRQQLRHWIIEFKAMHPEMKTPDIP